MSQAPLPSIDDILQSTKVMSNADASATVVQVGDSMVVKYGGPVSLLEARTLTYVGQHSNVPVPKVFGTLTDEETGRNYIVMELVRGQTLEKAWPSLSPPERREVATLIQQAISELRRMPSGGYIGSVNREPCVDGVFWTPKDEYDPAISGPFDTENDMNEGILRKLTLTSPASYINLLRTLMSSTLHNHQIVFTHGDLQPKNIMVQKLSNQTDGLPTLSIKIIDWEISGWYPDYWEFCNATICGRFKPDWLQLMQDIMPVHPSEYLMMEFIRHLIFY